MKKIKLMMCSFVKLYFKLNNECTCYCIGTNDDNDDYDIHIRRYKMIRIIEYGTINKKRCESCGCLFSYETEDIEHSTYLNFSNSACGYYYIICPQCNKEIQLEGDK